MLAAGRWPGDQRRAAPRLLAFIPLLGRLAIAAAGRGGTDQTRPGLADKAYSSKAIRSCLRRRGIKATIPEPADQIRGRLRRGSKGGRPPGFDRRPTSSATPSSAPSADCASTGRWPPGMTSATSLGPSRAVGQRRDLICSSEWLMLQVGGIALLDQGSTRQRADTAGGWRGPGRARPSHSTSLGASSRRRHPGSSPRHLTAGDTGLARDGPGRKRSHHADSSTGCAMTRHQGSAAHSAAARSCRSRFPANPSRKPQITDTP